jgi:hypothetical protein
MEKQKAKFKVYSAKTGGACLDLGNGEDWYQPTEKVKSFVSKLKRDSDVFVVVDDDNNLSFIQNAGNSVHPGNSESASNGNGMVRMSALKNATNIAISKGGSALDDTAVLETAKKFLNFLRE